VSRTMTVERCGSICDANDNSLMSLRGQGSGSSGAGGYAMAALLVAMAVMAVLMSVALPVWRHDAQREKEEELVWRGQQYVRAIRLFQRRTQALPSSVDMLVQGRYLRKKYKDPVTNEDFLPVPAAGAIPGQGGQSIGSGGQNTQPGGRGTGTTPSAGGFGASSGAGSSSGSAFTSTTVPGGMMGVVSKSKLESIRLYQGRNHYNEWTFLFVNQQPGGPGGVGGRGVPGGQNGFPQPGRPGGPGSPPSGTPTGRPPTPGIPGSGRIPGAGAPGAPGGTFQPPVIPGTGRGRSSQ
jgi:type II secretory pathway pseudopilin PulG